MTESNNEDELEVLVQNVSHSDLVPDSNRVKGWVRTVFEPGRRGELTVRIVDEPESADLNERYRHGKGATNVLAFPGEEPLMSVEDDLPSMGDLVICAPVIECEAAAQGKPLEAHWAHIAIHGALHLDGFDHEDEAGAAVMEARERELLGSLGIADPYAGDA